MAAESFAANQPTAAAAVRIIRELHFPDQGGCCNGCMTLFQRTVPYTDCPQTAWAAQVEGATPPRVGSERS